MSVTIRLFIQFWAVVIALIPTWLFLGLRALLDPSSEGFWAELVVATIGLVAFGGMQVLFIFLLVLFSVTVIWD